MAIDGNVQAWKESREKKLSSMFNVLTIDDRFVVLRKEVWDRIFNWLYGLNFLSPGNSREDQGLLNIKYFDENLSK